MSRTASRLLSSSFARVSLNTARAPHVALTRRTMSSASHASHGSTSSDRPWMIGSALVFGPLFLYLVSPSARKGSHHGHADHGHDNHPHEHEDTRAQHIESHREEDVKPIADDEGTEVSAQEVKESMEKAFEADSPKDAQEREEAVITAEENSPSEAHPQAESSAEATPSPSSESNAIPVVPVGPDATADATSDEKVEASGAATVDSKA